ncbi:MAG: BrnT family toxin [Thermosynechococcaceae cyanobacterium]
MNFEWDTQKRQDNINKHGVDFTEAAQVFYDPLRIEVLDDRWIEEERWLVLGITSLGVLFVVYTVRGQTYRIISARRATKNERRDYRKN